MTLYSLPPTLVEQRRNRATNPRLGIDAAGFGVSGTWDAAGRELAPGPTGEVYAWRAARTSAAGPSHTVYYSMPFLPRDWRVGFLVRAEASGGTVSVAAAPNADLSSAYHSALIPADGEWHWVGFTFTTSGATAPVYIGVRFDEGTTDMQVDMTSILIEEGTTPPTSEDYFHGSFLDTAAKDYSWAGTPDASASILSVPNAASTIEPVMTLAPYTARREAGAIVHRLLEDSQARFTWRQPNLPVGVFQFLFDGHAAAYAALSKLSARTAWALVDDADDGPIERWFMIADGDIEMAQDEGKSAYIVRVPYVEVDSI